MADDQVVAELERFLTDRADQVGDQRALAAADAGQRGPGPGHYPARLPQVRSPADQ